MYTQRRVSQESFNRRKREVLWSPRVKTGRKVRTIAPIVETNWYAVVDDIAEGIVVLQIASWPKLDRGNHLLFDRIYAQSYPLRALQRAVNRERTKQGQPAPDRPLRTGDAFLIQCKDPPGEKVVTPEFEGLVLDITAAAREQAKIAMYGVVTRGLKPTEVEKRQKTSEKPDRFRQITEIQKRPQPSNLGATARPEV